MIDFGQVWPKRATRARTGRCDIRGNGQGTGEAQSDATASATPPTENPERDERGADKSNSPAPANPQSSQWMSSRSWTSVSTPATRQHTPGNTNMEPAATSGRGEVHTASDGWASKMMQGSLRPSRPARSEPSNDGRGLPRLRGQRSPLRWCLHGAAMRLRLWRRERRRRRRLLMVENMR